MSAELVVQLVLMGSCFVLGWQARGAAIASSRALSQQISDALEDRRPVFREEADR